MIKIRFTIVMLLFFLIGIILGQTVERGYFKISSIVIILFFCFHYLPDFLKEYKKDVV